MRHGSLMLGMLTIFLLACPSRPAQDPVAGEAQARYLVAMGHMEEGRFGDAVVELNASIEIDPSRAQAHHSLGESYIGIARYKDAEAGFRQALLLEPGKYLSHLGLGHSLRLQGRYREAIEAYRVAAGLEPERPQPHIFMAEVMQRAGDEVAAAAAFAEGARLTPPEERAGTLARNARALASAGRHEEAIRIFEEVVGVVPEDSESWLGLAESRVRTGDLREAAQAYETASKLDPEDVVTYELLATVHDVLGEEETAVSVFERANENVPGSARLWKGLARLHLSKGRREQALEAAEQSLAHLGGEDPRLIRSVAELLADLGDAVRSSELYRLLLLETDDDPSLWVDLAKQLTILGRTEDVKSVCARIVELSERNGRNAAGVEWCLEQSRE